ncbi:hypothetical protein REPUB_Repub14bG0095500 [Reevesia pubescens]
MASLSLFLVWFLVLSCEVIAVQRNLDESNDIVMEEEELLRLFDVIGSLLNEPGWAKVHPKPCTNTPWPVNLEQLDLSYNNLSGEIPKEIRGLKSLTILDLSSNGLEGMVPFALGQLQLLQKVDLCANMIHGRIPPELGNLNKLVLLDLSHNFINGPIPETLSGSIPNLDRLNLSRNKLSGELLLLEEFIKRLGKRLDVRENNGLCTSYQLSRNNISTYLQARACLSKEGIVNNETCPEEHPDDFKGSKPSWYHGKISSSALSQNPQFISICFVVFHMLSFL